MAADSKEMVAEHRAESTGFKTIAEELYQDGERSRDENHKLTLKLDKAKDESEQKSVDSKSPNPRSKTAWPRTRQPVSLRHPNNSARHSRNTCSVVIQGKQGPGP